MESRELGRTGWKISTISLGTWAMGSLWGPVDDRESLATLNRALDLGVNFFDTADVYGSEPIEVYNEEVFGILDDLKKQGKIRHYGVSVECIVEAEKAMEFPGVQSVMIIFNIFRQRPAEVFLTEAKRRGVGILARVPLASGMLTGKMTRATTFSPDDHRAFNRQGRAFDKGEMFSGVDFEVGLKAVEELRPLVPAGATMAQMALRWILMFDAVACAIPGAKRPTQAEDNIRAADLPPLSDAMMEKIRTIYDRHIRAQVHHQW